MNAYAVITSINFPTGAVAEWARKPGWRVIVVGDRKTPDNWQLTNVEMLAVGQQIDDFARSLRENHYCRKMLGYVHAIRAGADVILDTDDDNYPDPGWEAKQAFDAKDGVAVTSSEPWLNIHAVFGDPHSWPRGFPLRYVTSTPQVTRLTAPEIRIGVWQGLVAEDPDIDAIYRLTRRDRPVFSRDGMVALELGRACPFNSQNTLFRKELFPLLYLPTTVTFRFTDILRSLVAQPIMWAHEFHLGFAAPNARQKRNEHDLMADFQSEIPMYKQVEEALRAVRRAVHDVQGDRSVEMLLVAAYAELARVGIVEPRECELLRAWLFELNQAKR